MLLMITQGIHSNEIIADNSVIYWYLDQDTKTLEASSCLKIVNLFVLMITLSLDLLEVHVYDDLSRIINESNQH